MIFKKKVRPKFVKTQLVWKIGDRVTFSRTDHSWANHLIGRQGTVEQIKFNNAYMYGVNFNNVVGLFFCSEYELHP